MEETSIAYLQREILRLYTAGLYLEARDLLKQAGEEYRPYAADILYWRACLSSLLGETDTALRALTEAAEAGFFYGEGALDDPDLEPLRQRGDFQRLRALFLKRQEAARSSGTLQMFVSPPTATNCRRL